MCRLSTHCAPPPTVWARSIEPFRGGGRTACCSVWRSIICSLRRRAAGRALVRKRPTGRRRATSTVVSLRNPQCIPVEAAVDGHDGVARAEVHVPIGEVSRRDDGPFLRGWLLGVHARTIVVLRDRRLSPWARLHYHRYLDSLRLRRCLPSLRLKRRLPRRGCRVPGVWMRGVRARHAVSHAGQGA